MGGWGISIDFNHFLSFLTVRDGHFIFEGEGGALGNFV